MRSSRCIILLNKGRQLHNNVASSKPVTTPLFFLDGKRVEAVNTNTSQQFDLKYPATGQVLQRVQCAGQEDVSRAVASAKKAQVSWCRKSGFERGQVLRRAADIVRERVEELARVETLDTGKSIWEARCDIEEMANSMEYYGGLAADIKGEYLDTGDGCFAYTIRAPLGVVGGIGAWNYPFQMAVWKSCPALACGNGFVYKPSQETPLTAVMLGEIFKEAGLPDGLYNVIQGEGESGQLLCDHGDIDKITFTGSVPTGSKIMAACAKGIKHVSLELGGKSPLIIFEDCSIDNAVTGAMLANFLSQGQVCSNGTRVFVQKSIVAPFLEKLIARTRAMKIGDPFAEDTTVGATVSRQQADKVLNYIEIAKKEGATIHCGGEEVTPEPRFSGGQFISPCILTDVNDNMTVAKEEVFGPVLSVLEFDCEDEVVARANNTEFGLAGGVFTKDLHRAHRVAANVQAGALYVNHYNKYPPGVAFGGFKMSGIGRENGRDALDYFSQLKSVYVEMNDLEAPF